MHYNIPPPPDFSAFNISTQTLGKCDGTKKSLIVSVDVRYSGIPFTLEIAAEKNDFGRPDQIPRNMSYRSVILIDSKC